MNLRSSELDCPTQEPPAGAHGFHQRTTRSTCGPLRHSLAGARFLPVIGGARFVFFVFMVETDDNRTNRDICDMSERDVLH